MNTTDDKLDQALKDSGYQYDSYDKTYWRKDSNGNYEIARTDGDSVQAPGSYTYRQHQDGDQY